MIKWISLLLTAVMLVMTGGAGAPAAAEEMSMLAFNVGKADCILLRSGKTTYLIDTARGKKWEQVEAWLGDEGVDHLDAVIITHTDKDHVGGLKKLLKSKISVDHVYTPAFYHPEDKENKENPTLKAASKQNVEVEYLKGGDELPLDGGTLRVIGPISAAEDKEDNNSLVMVAEAAGGSILLAGDMEFPEETELLNAGVIPRADVLKVGNHGDDDATSTALLSAVQPKIAVISTSTEEKKSTPARRVIRALDSWSVKILQTQEAERGILVTIRDGDISAERLGN